MNEDTQKRLVELWDQLQQTAGEMSKLLVEQGTMDIVPDYDFTALDGSPVKLSSMFDGHATLVLVHNMGFHCPYCTLWADGLNGIWRHLESGEYGQQARFVLVSEDTPEEQRAGREKRGWTFDMFSARDTDFTREMGFKVTQDGEDYLQPGMSVFERHSDGRISRHASTFFGPGDLYCSLFHIFNLLPGGSDEA
jgi:predicted dithiol-disulfide oxidoreductase (DUF899 family)